jgi:hypothetical protein
MGQNSLDVAGLSFDVIRRAVGFRLSVIDLRNKYCFVAACTGSSCCCCPFDRYPTISAPTVPSFTPLTDLPLLPRFIFCPYYIILVLLHAYINSIEFLSFRG